VTAAAARADRSPDTIRILAVGKRQSVAAITAAAAAGLTDFGENYLQEALPKVAHFEGLTWHFIGAVQGNKTRAIAEHFAWVHTVDRPRIVRRLAEGRGVDRAPLNVCIEVNISGERSKSGVTPEKLGGLAAEVVRMPQLRLRGLMTLPEPSDDYATQYAAFSRLAEMQRRLCDEGYLLDTLSMGTSADFEAAIAAGATIIRIGTELFGARGPC
jgi:pyridoxal phosphate enzyme (YggS family)